MISARHLLVVAIVLTVAVSAMYLTVSLTTDERPVAPLDDAYITFQYARQIARGQPYRYNDGEPPTTGMTSPLFGFLMAGAYLLGFTGESLPGLAVGLGVLWLSLTSLLCYRITLQLTKSQSWSYFAAILVTLTGPVQWGCFNGMETGLFSVLTLAAVNAFLADRMTQCAWWVTLAAVTRTEGLILAGLMCFTVAVESLLDDGRLDWKQLIHLSPAMAIGLAPFAVNWVLTGTTSAAGLRAKSWFLNVPSYPKDIVNSILISYSNIVIGRFLAGNGWFVAPGLVLFSLLGWIELAIQQRWRPMLLTLSWFVVGTLSTATLITATWHVGRYQVPFVPIVTIVAVYALTSVMRQVDKSWKHLAIGATALYLLLSCGYSTVLGGELYCLAVKTVSQQQLVIADWLRENLPTNTRVGVHDTGSLRYVGMQPTYDLIGLTTPDTATAWRHGAGSVFKQMEHSPLRPSYFAIYPDVFSLPYLAKTDLFAEELFRVEVPDYAIASAGAVQGVWRADWHLAGSGDAMHQADILGRTAGLRLVDSLDLACLDDEAAHRMEWWHDGPPSGFPTEVWQLSYRVPPQREVLDGGRLVTGGISVDVKTEPHRPLWIAARLHAQEAGAVTVVVDGQQVGRWAYPPIPGEWLETLFQVPADHVTTPHTRIQLIVDADDPRSRHYAPYHLWFLQGEVEDPSIAAQYAVGASFAEDIVLDGFDIPKISWRPGEVVPIALYWRAIQSPAGNDAKVFVHLYGPDGHLGPQADGWAFHGTRPPYTWTAGETITDPRSLVLPDGLPPGEYSLEVGLYNPDAGDRLPAYSDSIRLPEDRVVLIAITVR